MILITGAGAKTSKRMLNQSIQSRLMNRSNHALQGAGEMTYPPAIPKPALSLSKGGEGAGRLMILLIFQGISCFKRHWLLLLGGSRSIPERSEWWAGVGFD